MFQKLFTANRIEDFSAQALNWPNLRCNAFFELDYCSINNCSSYVRLHRKLNNRMARQQRLPHSKYETLPHLLFLICSYYSFLAVFRLPFANAKLCSYNILNYWITIPSSLSDSPSPRAGMISSGCWRCSPALITSISLFPNFAFWLCVMRFSPSRHTHRKWFYVLIFCMLARAPSRACNVFECTETITQCKNKQNGDTPHPPLIHIIIERETNWNDEKKRK